MSDEAAADSSPRPSPAGASRRLRWFSSDAWIDVLIAAGVVVVIAGPVLFTKRPFQVDTTNSIWLASVMSHSVGHGLPPSFFLNTNNVDFSGIFNPVFAFYGGPLFALFGVLISILGGSALAAFAVLMVLAIVAAYGGTAWLSRQCGLRGRLVHVPAIVVVSAAYYLTDLYGRGDVAEFVALSVIPLVIASITHLVRAPSWKPGPTVLLVVSVICFTGSHNITLLWATIIAAGALVVLGVVLRPRPLPVKRLLEVGGLVLLATMVNAWFLLPDVAFSKSTTAGTSTGIMYTYFDRFGLLFNLARSVPKQSSSPGLYVQLPVWFLLWSLACGAYIWRTRSLAFLRKSWTAVAVLFAGVVGLVMATPLWPRLPATLQEIQFPYRLNGYVVLLAAGLVLVSLLAVQHDMLGARRSGAGVALVVSLVAVTGISVGLAVWQEWVPKSCPTGIGGPACVANRSVGLTPPQVLPPTWYAGNLYADSKQPTILVPPDRIFVFAPAEVDGHGDRLEATVNPPGGSEPFVTNILAGPKLVSVSGGIERIGRTEGGYMVARRVDAGDGPVDVVIRTADSLPIALGRWLSLIGVIGVLLLLSAELFLTQGRRRRRRVGPLDQ